MSDSRNIILMHGYVCSLKTTISTKLSDELKIPRYETKDLGAVILTEDKDSRYRRFTQLAREALTGDQSILLDGTFGKKEYRDSIYSLADEIGIDEMIILNCYCNDENEVWRRLGERGKSNEIVCVKEWLNQSYGGLQQDSYNGRQPTIFDIDTFKYKIKASNLQSSFASKVHKKLLKILNNIS